MGILLLVSFILMEIVLMVLSFTKYQTKKEWLSARWIIRAGELAVFLFVMLLPVVTFDFKYKICFCILVIRLLRVLLAYFFERKSVTGMRSKAGAVVGGTVSCVILAVSLVPAFIFTEYSGLETSGQYEVLETETILIDHNRLESFETDGSYREIPMHFYYPKTDEDVQSTFPVVVFSHGAFGYYQSNTSTYHELASNGYIVISLDHPYHSFFTQDTDGKLITVNPAFLQEVMYINENTTSEEEINDLSHSWLKIRTDDMNYVLDSLELAKQENRLDDSWYIKEASNKDTLLSILQMADVEKIGLMGHSLGGASSVSVGRERDDISCVIDLDGTMLGEQLSYENGAYYYIEEPYPIPVFAMDSESHFEDGKQYGVLYVNNYVLENAKDARHEYIAGAEHMNFTDLPLFAPPIANMLGTGTADATECIMEMNAMVLEYMNCYLKGDNATWK